MGDFLNSIDGRSLTDQSLQQMGARTRPNFKPSIRGTKCCILLWFRTIYEFFKHDIDTGKFTGRTIKFSEPMTKVQGACFSPNGHLYIASNTSLPGNKRYQIISYYSALNGYLLGRISVLAEEGMPDQELEGIAFANVSFANGKTAQIYAVLLENRDAALDNIFFKSFSSGRPDFV